VVGGGTFGRARTGLRTRLAGGHGCRGCKDGRFGAVPWTLATIAGLAPRLWAIPTMVIGPEPAGLPTPGPIRGKIAGGQRPRR